jgi:Flp pilus assembly protein TadG
MPSPLTTPTGEGCAERGFVTIYMAVTLTVLLIFVGLALDAGRAYVVKAQLSKAVDGAALGAARMLNSGDPRGEASRIFNANFPVGFMGTNSVTNPATDPNFFTLRTVNETGVNIVTVTATATVPTSFMRLANFQQLSVVSSGEATRRMVDLSLILDVSSSIGSRWGAVRDAARTFVSAFDQNHDRVALILYSNGARVIDQMYSGRGFDKTRVMADIPNSLPGGSTAMVEGLYRGWDELRAVPSGEQSSLRVIVLFTDGASNSVPGNHDGTGISKGLRTFDFPKNFPDPDGQTWDDPTIAGLYDAETGVASPNLPALRTSIVASPCNKPWCNTERIAAVPLLPVRSFHGHHRSSGIPTSFDLQTNSLTVRGVPQSTIRGLRQKDVPTGRYPAQVWNINNAARNLLEIIANQARNDDGDYPIRIYTIGMGELVQYMLGTMPEQPEEILMRVANDKRSPDYNSNQLEGKYYFARTEADVGPAFQALQNQIIRLSK